MISNTAIWLSGPPYIVYSGPPIGTRTCKAQRRQESNARKTQRKAQKKVAFDN